MKRASKRKPWFIALLAGVVAAAFAVTPVEAAPFGGASLSISPPIVDLNLDPGRETTFDVYLGNGSDRAPVRLKAMALPIEQDRAGAYRVVEKAGPWSAVPWVELPKTQFDLAPGQGVNAVVRVKVPRGATGSRAAAVVFEVVPEARAPQEATGATAGSTTFLYRLVTIVKVTVNARTNRREASITSLTMARGADDTRVGKYGDKALAIICTVQNEGNVIINGQGRLLIRNAEGRRVKDVPLGGDRGVILPGATVDFLSIFPGGLPVGKYTAEAMIRYGGLRPLQARIPFEIKADGVAADKASLLQTVRFTSSPEQFQTQLPPGAVRTFLLSLVNREEQPLAVRGRIAGLTADREGGLAPTDEAGGPWSAASWLILESTSLTLAPGEKRNVRVTAAVPKDAEPGSRYASVVFEAERGGGEGGGATTTVATPVVITTGRQLIRKASLLDPDVIPVTNPDGLAIGGLLVNEGNTHLTVSGNVTLRKRGEAPVLPGGMEYLGEAKFEDVATVSFPESSGWVLPGSGRLMVILYDKALAPGDYQAEVMVNFGGEIPARATVTFKVAPRETGAAAAPASGK